MGLKMAKKKIFRKSKAFTIPIAPVAGLIAGIADPIDMAIHGNYYGAMEQTSMNYTGYSIAAKNWDIGRMWNGLVPLVVGILVHKYIGVKLGVNKALARAGVPLIRI